MPPILKAITGGLAVSAICLLLLVVVVFAVASAWPAIRESLKRLAPGARRMFLFAAAAATLWGGAKFYPVRNAGADATIALCGIEYESDTTNDVTTIRVLFTGNGVNVNTPVSYRNAETEQWTEVVKINPAITVDGGITNALTFTAAGLLGLKYYWWVGTETPAVIIETTGITITSFVATANYVSIAWECDDPRATVYAVQRRRRGAVEWETVNITTSHASIYTGFTVGETWEWRIYSVYADEEEGQ